MPNTATQNQHRVNYAVIYGNTNMRHVLDAATSSWDVLKLATVMGSGQETATQISGCAQQIMSNSWDVHRRQQTQSQDVHGSNTNMVCAHVGNTKMGVRTIATQLQDVHVTATNS
ncbi:hypothetical protein Hamer_G018829 [Homarus americanus]|uniref:Uncharacterized protein n=1 Tax=Homarus americanus TaxID=6706 RepID=A0A8J5JNH4_HOMAM|nr:hypothetical protein Hamer_G018829 [Homarus americanus]